MNMPSATMQTHPYSTERNVPQWPHRFLLEPNEEEKTEGVAAGGE